MKLSIRHELIFDLGTPSRALLHLLLTPLNTPQQKVQGWSISMPGIKDAASFRDGFGNRAQLLTLSKPEGPIEIVVEGSVETMDRAGVLGRLELDPVPALFKRVTAATKPDETLTGSIKSSGDRIAMLHELMGYVHRLAVGPAQAQTQGSQRQSSSAEESDAADAFIGAARALGFAARHVTGYVLDESGGAFRGWAEVWEDGLGWIGFDPLLDLCPAEGHVRVACGLDGPGCVPVRTVPAWTAPPDETVRVTAD
ncbi:MAG TPA: transglutaminase domain-containing protein [Devosia sp.]|nr:transglutaminase domain-containing protein [Devosia sp.]